MIKKIIILFVSIILAVIPFYNMVINVYSWHMTQPEFVLGGIEILVFVILSCITVFCLKNNDKILFLLTLLFALYLSLNGVIIPVVVDYLYMEILLYIGHVTVCHFKLPSNKQWDFLMGISIWGMTAVILSIFNHGTINELRWMTVLLFVIAVINNPKEKYSISVWDFAKYLKSNIENKKLMFISVIFIYVVAMMFAKSNNALDYDSLWYGLRPEYVLIGDTSFYDYLGFSSFVYYYPKLMELLYIPISGLGDYSFIICMNVYIYTMLIYTSWCIVRCFIACESRIWSVLIAILSIPAVVNISATAKPDILGCTLVIISFYMFICYKTRNSMIYVIGACISLLLCTGTKLTYLLWGGITLCYYLLVVIKNNSLGECFRSIKYYLVSIPGIIFVGGVHYRTYRLTGYPIYPICINLFRKLGFEPRNGMKSFSITTDANMGCREVIHRLYEYIFNPSQLPHVIMLWTSNVFLIMAFIYMVIKNNKTKDRDYFVYIIVMTIAMIYEMIYIREPDGNYYIYPLIVVSILLSIKFLRERKIDIEIYSFIPIIVVNLVFCMVSHSSWAWGTHIPSGNVIVDNFETSSNNERIFLNRGWRKVTDYINNYMSADYIISSDLDYTLLGRVPGRIETFHEVSSDFFSDKYIESYIDFLSYVKNHDVNGILCFSEDNSVLREYIICYENDIGFKDVIVDEYVTLYVF